MGSGIELSQLLRIFLFALSEEGVVGWFEGAG